MERISEIYIEMMHNLKETINDGIDGIHDNKDEALVIFIFNVAKLMAHYQDLANKRKEDSVTTCELYKKIIIPGTKDFLKEAEEFANKLGKK